MIDHYTLLVSDLDRSWAFYQAALGPIGYELIMDLTKEQIPSLPVDRTIGVGANGKPDLWLAPSDVIAPTHIAFSGTREQVDQFYAKALEAGGKDNGPPGMRAHYHPNYYGAFVIDPDGYNVEVVCHAPA